MRDARNRNRQVFGATGGSISFGAKVNLAFRGKLGDMEVEKHGALLRVTMSHLFMYLQGI